mmetsp:Transcript_82355/g.142819  ORF Transcript_82355/g.142819 Transcript_82355/m.142819 type:complete len:511 (-) Transcript_82355:84-1616(-)
MQKFCLVLACLACAGSQSAESRKPVKDARSSMSAPETSLARLLLAVNSPPAFSFSTPKSGTPSTAVSTRRSRVRHSAPVMDPRQKLEMLTDELELAVRLEDYAKAAKLRDRLKAFEEASPAQALKYQQQRQMKNMLDKALFSGEAVRDRQAAIQSLKEAASPPMPVSGAEEALHRILREVDGDDADAISEAVTDALWEFWLQSGDDEADALMKKGIKLMEERDLQEAAKVFTKVIQIKPDFAEAWNKRATVYFILKDFKKAMADCKEVLERKPKHFGCLAGLAMCYFSQEPPNADAGLKWCQEALEVHPRLSNLKLIVSKLTMQTILQEQMNPQIPGAIEALKKGKEPKFAPGDVDCTWDVHRIDGERDNVFQYFFRVTYKNTGSKTQTVSGSAKSLARFYVLQYEDGEVFYFTRLMEEASPSQFSLRPGEEYKFCWMLIVSQEVKGMTGGTLFELLDGSPKKRQGFTNAGMPVLSPKLADAVTTSAEVEELGEGHYFTGQLDLRRRKKQ